MTTEKVKEKSETKKTKAGATGQIKKKAIKLPVLLKPGEIGYIVAEVPILPGCISQGKTQEEALANIKDAAELYLSCGPLPDVLKQYALKEVEVNV